MPFLLRRMNGNIIGFIELIEETTLGRSPDNDVVIPDLTVSQYHAKVQRSDQGWQLIDCESTNGISTQGEKKSSVLLADGLTFSLGTQTFEYCDTLPLVEDQTLKIKKSWIPGVYYTE